MKKEGSEGERNMLQGENDRVQGENKRFWKGGKNVPKGGEKRNLEGEKNIVQGWKKGSPTWNAHAGNNRKLSSINKTKGVLNAMCTKPNMGIELLKAGGKSSKSRCLFPGPK